MEFSRVLCRFGITPRQRKEAESAIALLGQAVREGRSHGSEDDGVGFRHALTVHGPRYELSVHVPHVVSKISRVLQPFADALGTLSRWEHLPRAITHSEGSLAKIGRESCRARVCQSV